MFLVLTTLFTSIVIVIYHVSKLKLDYWKKRKIPYAEAVPILGNFGSYILQRKCLGQVTKGICEKFPDAPYFGAFYGTEPTLIVQDPEIIKLIMAKDFYYFNGREISKYTKRETVTQNLFFTYGDRWRVLRQNLTPIFSSSKMTFQNMFHLIDKCAQDFEKMLDREIETDNVQGIRSLMARFTMDSIGSCAFGVETGTLEKDSQNNPFTIIGNSIFLESIARGAMLVTRAIWPAVFYGLGMQIAPTEASTFFSNLMKGVFEGRQYKPTNRHDFVDQILNWVKNNNITGDSITNMKGDSKKVNLEVDDQLLVAQCLLFFIAGYETSSTTLQYTFYELAKHPEIQQRAIDEIDEYLLRHNNKLEYECITELPFTEACIDEALRLHPVLVVLTREVFDDYTLPCGAVLEKGVRVHIPVYELHHNPDYFPDPEEFRPERFYGEEKVKIKPYTYMPFGDGPRICIGIRFAKMQMLAGIVTVLKRYRVELAEGTPRKLEFTPRSPITSPRQLIKLKFVERDGWQQRLYKH